MDKKIIAISRKRLDRAQRLNQHPVFDRRRNARRCRLQLLVLRDQKRLALSQLSCSSKGIGEAMQIMSDQALAVTKALYGVGLLLGEEA